MLANYLATRAHKSAVLVVCRKLDIWPFFKEEFLGRRIRGHAGKAFSSLGGMRRVILSHPSQRGSPQDKKGNVFGHFQALTPQQGGQICVNQAVLLGGVFQKDFPKEICLF